MVIHYSSHSVLPEEDEDCDSGHSSSGHGSLETAAADAIAIAIAGGANRGEKSAVILLNDSLG